MIPFIKSVEGLTRFLHYQMENNEKFEEVAYPTYVSSKETELLFRIKGKRYKDCILIQEYKIVDHLGTELLSIPDHNDDDRDYLKVAELPQDISDLIDPFIRDFIHKYKRGTLDNYFLLKNIKPLLPYRIRSSNTEEYEIQSSNIQSSNSNETPENNLKEEKKEFITQIFNHLGSGKNKGWKYAFKNEIDYELFVDIMVNYFMGNNYQLPNHPFDLNFRTKTNVATVFSPIYKKFKTSQDILIKDKEYLRIIKTLKPFSELSDSDVYRCINRN